MGLVNNKKTDVKRLKAGYDSLVLKTLRGGEDDFGISGKVLKDFFTLLLCLTAADARATYSCLQEL